MGKKLRMEAIQDGYEDFERNEKGEIILGGTPEMFHTTNDVNFSGKNVENKYLQILHDVYKTEKFAVNPAQFGIAGPPKTLAAVDYLIGITEPLYVGLLQAGLRDINKRIFPTIVTQNTQYITHSFEMSQDHPARVPEFGTAPTITMKESSVMSRSHRYMHSFQISKDMRELRDEGTGTFFLFLEQTSGTFDSLMEALTFYTMLQAGIPCDALHDINGKISFDDISQYRAAITKMYEDFVVAHKTEKGLSRVINAEKIRMMQSTGGNRPTIVFIPQECLDLVAYSATYMGSSEANTMNMLGTDSARPGGGTLDFKYLNNLGIYAIPAETFQERSYHNFYSLYRTGGHLFIDPSKVHRVHDSDVDSWKVIVNDVYLGGYAPIHLHEAITEGFTFIHFFHSPPDDKHDIDNYLFEVFVFAITREIVSYVSRNPNEGERKKLRGFFSRYVSFQTIFDHLSGATLNEKKNGIMSFVNKFRTDLSIDTTPLGFDVVEKAMKEAKEHDPHWKNEKDVVISQSMIRYYVDYVELFQHSTFASFCNRHTFQWTEVPFFNRDHTTGKVKAVLSYPCATIHGFSSHFNLMLSRPLSTVETRPVVLAQEGPETMFTYTNYPKIVANEIAQNQSIDVSVSQWIGHHVVNPTRIRIKKDTFISRFFGGESSTIVNREMVNHYKDNRFYLKSDNAPSVYVMVYPKSTKVQSHPFIHNRGRCVLDLTGPEEYPHAAFWSSMFEWEFRNEIVNDEFIPGQVSERSLPMYHEYTDHATKNVVKIEGKSPYGFGSETPFGTTVKQTGNGRFPYAADPQNVQTRSF
jgi:hypothetical protein